MEIYKEYNLTADIQSLTKQLGDLINIGYRHKFRREANCIFCLELYAWIPPDQFNVDEVYYFVDSLNPDTDRILYAITTESGIKGTLVDQYGVYADNMSLELNQKLGWEGKKSGMPEY